MESDAEEGSPAPLETVLEDFSSTDVESDESLSSVSIRAVGSSKKISKAAAKKAKKV